MVKLFKKEDILLGSPLETMGFSKDNNLVQISMNQNVIIKKYNFSSIKQIEDIKSQLLRKKILLINAREILENKRIKIEDIKLFIDELKSFLKDKGGSVGRLGGHYLILTPNANVKIAN